jgi:hypothetical protein
VNTTGSTHLGQVRYFFELFPHQPVNNLNTFATEKKAQRKRMFNLKYSIR